MKRPQSLDKLGAWAALSATNPLAARSLESDTPTRTAGSNTQPDDRAFKVLLPASDESAAKEAHVIAGR